MDDDPSFLSKRALLAHTGRLLCLQISRLEQCANGAVFCQLVDAHFAGIVPMHKVNFIAREEHEILGNYKALQTALVQLEVTKDIEVAKLSKGHAASSLELLQWLFKFLKKRVVLDGYDAKQRRLVCKGGRTEEVPVPSCLVASFDMSPGSPASCGSSKNRTWSSRDIVGGKVDVSHVVSRYKEGLLRPVILVRPDRVPGQGAVRTARPQHGSVDQGVDADLVLSGMYAGTQTDDPDVSFGDAESAYRDGDDGLGSPIASDSRAAGEVSEVGFEADSTCAARQQGPVAGEADEQGAGPGTVSDDLVEDEQLRAQPQDEAFAGFAAVQPLPPQQQALRQAPGDSAGEQLQDSHPAAPDETLVVEDTDLDLQLHAEGREAARPGVAPGSPEDAAASSFGDTLQPRAIGYDDDEVESVSLPLAATEAQLACTIAVAPESGTDDDDPEAADAAKAPGPQGSGGEGQAQPCWSDLPPDAAALLFSPAANRGQSFQGTELLGDALAAAEAALDEVEEVLARLQRQRAAPPAGPASDLMLRGKLRSLMGATRTAVEHTALLLGDVAYQCDSGPTASEASIASEPAARCAALTQRLGSLRAQLDSLWPQLLERCSSPEPVLEALAGSPADEGQGQADSLARMSSELLSTCQLDAVVKAVGQAQFSLMQAWHKHAAALTANFLQASDGAASPSGRPASSSKGTRCFKLGGLQLKKLRNGDVYRGRYHSGKKNGDGVYNFLNNDVFEGEFTADRMDGHGVYTFSHEGRYEGGWQSAVYAGYGTETFSKGSTYYGQYSAGLRNGFGACRFFNGDFYEGTWANGLRDGQGMQQCTDDSNYVGEYVKGKRHGSGVYSFPNGDRYLGEYADDLPHGHGVYVFSSGQKYEGEWSQGKKHGWSIYTVDNGQEFVGQWQDSKPQWIQAMKGSQDQEAKKEPGAARTDGIPLDVHELATAAKSNAKGAARAALLCAQHHWTHASPVLVASSVQSAAQAAAQAQAARKRALDIANKLNSAHLLSNQ